MTTWLLQALLLAVLGLLVRLLYVLTVTCQEFRRRKHAAPLKTLIVLGSGGHTAEMMNLVRGLNRESYRPRVYIAAATDSMSLRKAQALEEEGGGGKRKVVPGDVRYCSIYRSREVGQSYATSVLTTLRAIAHGVIIVFSIRPDLVLCNGPGTCLPICVAAFMLKVLGLRRTALVYVESVARVQKLSLTGSLFYKLGIIDKFYVQWPGLRQKYPRTEYVGRLM